MQQVNAGLAVISFMQLIHGPPWENGKLEFLQRPNAIAIGSFEFEVGSARAEVVLSPEKPPKKRKPD